MIAYYLIFGYLLSIPSAGYLIYLSLRDHHEIGGDLYWWDIALGIAFMAIPVVNTICVIFFGASRFYKSSWNEPIIRGKK